MILGSFKVQRVKSTHHKFYKLNVLNWSIIEKWTGLLRRLCRTLRGHQQLTEWFDFILFMKNIAIVWSINILFKNDGDHKDRPGGQLHKIVSIKVNSIVILVWTIVDIFLASCPTSAKSVSYGSLQLKGRGWTVIRLYGTHKETFICSNHKQSHTSRLDNSTIILPEEAIHHIYLSLSHTHTHRWLALTSLSSRKGHIIMGLVLPGDISKSPCFSQLPNSYLIFIVAVLKVI